MNRWRLTAFQRLSHRTSSLTTHTHLINVAILFTSLITVACSKNNDAKNNLPLKSQQYYVQGEKLYITHCSNCHQQDGTGLRQLYPPVNTSDFMDNNFEKVVCLMKYGIEGEIQVNGTPFNQKMSGVSTLSDLEITEISTYIYNKWGHRRDSITLQEVSRILRECKSNN